MVIGNFPIFVSVHILAILVIFLPFFVDHPRAIVDHVLMIVDCFPTFVIISRSILDEYKLILTSLWYQWEYLPISKEFVFFCRVSKRLAMISPSCDHVIVIVPSLPDLFPKLFKVPIYMAWWFQIRNIYCGWACEILQNPASPCMVETP